LNIATHVELFSAMDIGATRRAKKPPDASCTFHEYIRPYAQRVNIGPGFAYSNMTVNERGQTRGKEMRAKKPSKKLRNSKNLKKVKNLTVHNKLLPAVQ
jgi:hypothetical protein